MDWKVIMKTKQGILLILVLSILFAGCSNSNKSSKSDKIVDVYYINSKTSGLVSENHTLKTTTPDDQIKELLNEVKLNPNNAVYKSAVPEKTLVGYTPIKSGSLTINFDESYNELSDIDKISGCAAIVKTLTQIKGVEEIQFSVNGQPMKNTNGDVIVPLDKDDFIDNTETNMSYKIKLYFANRKGDALVETIANINYSGTESIEEQVIQLLINGPDELGIYPTIPKGTKLLTISKADGICRVNFNEKLLDKLPNIKEEIAIYSIVNTLVELPDINKVQFTINGEVQKSYMEITFDQPLEGQLDLIENPD